MARADFIEQLRQLGFEAQDLGDGRVAFPYEIQLGKFAGQTVKLGFVVGEDFPLNPPSGPHVSPRLLPINPGGQHPAGGVNESPAFGPDWEYWSRPIKHWAETKRTARDVLAHVKRLFDTQ